MKLTLCASYHSKHLIYILVTDKWKTQAGMCLTDVRTRRPPWNWKHTQGDRREGAQL